MADNKKPDSENKKTSIVNNDDEKYMVAEDDPLLGKNNKKSDDISDKTVAIQNQRNKSKEDLSSQDTVLISSDNMELDKQPTQFIRNKNNLNSAETVMLKQEIPDVSGVDVMVGDYLNTIYDEDSRVHTGPSTFNNPQVQEQIQPVLNQERQQIKKQKRILWIIVASICILAVAVGVLLWMTFNDTQANILTNTNENTNQNIVEEINANNTNSITGEVTREVRITITADGWQSGDLPYLVRLSGKPEGAYQYTTHLYQIYPGDTYITNIECGVWKVESLGSPITSQGAVFTDIDGEIEIKNADNIPYDIEISAYMKPQGTVSYQSLLMIQNYYTDEGFNSSDVDAFVKKAMEYYNINVSNKNANKNITPPTINQNTSNDNANANTNTENTNTNENTSNENENQGSDDYYNSSNQNNGSDYSQNSSNTPNYDNDSGSDYQNDYGYNDSGTGSPDYDMATTPQDPLEHLDHYFDRNEQWQQGAQMFQDLFGFYNSGNGDNNNQESGDQQQ